MQKIDWKRIGNEIGRTIHRRSPEILTGIGIAGMITTTVLAVKATPEAMRRIEARKRRENHKNLTAMQTVQAAWKCYIPAGVTGSVSVACLIGASVTNGRRNAALATAASLAETSLREYRSKVVETIGPRKEEGILDSIDRDRVQNLKQEQIDAMMEEPEGMPPKVRCLDAMFNKTFWSDVETIKHAVNKLNYQMNNLSEPYISLNEFYMELGLQPIGEIGDQLGWRNDKGLIEVRFTTQLWNGSTPVLVMSHANPPEYGYSDF